MNLLRFGLIEGGAGVGVQVPGSEFTHINQWAARTPEFQVTIVLVSSPLTLLVALWGMTSRQTLHAMTSKEQEVPLRQRVFSWGH